jgi:hypothetical protein
MVLAQIYGRGRRRRRLAHLATVSLVAAAVGLLPATAAHATSNTPATGSDVVGPGCGADGIGVFLASGTSPNTVNAGDYTDFTKFNVSSSPRCTNTTWYVLDKSGSATTTFEWWYGLDTFNRTPNIAGDSCTMWAYIPTADAGDRDARYDVWGETPSGTMQWLFWPGHTIDQENTSGWVLLGTHSMGPDATAEVTLNNSDNANPGWYTGAGAMAFSCTPVAAQMPTGLTATATGPNSIHVSWTDPSGGNMQTVVSNGNVSAPTLPYGSTSYDWTGLAPGTYMCFTVKGVNSAGTSSAWSPYSCVTTPVPTPTNVVATATSPNTVQVSWADQTGGTAKYAVFNGDTTSATLPAGTTSYTWSGLTSNQYMCFQATAVGANASSTPSPYSCVTTPWSETDARNDLLTRLAGPGTPLHLKVRATNVNVSGATDTLDTAKIIEVNPGSYLAVYSADSKVKLATSTDLANWVFETDLVPDATQPYLAEAADGSFVLADEQFDVPGSTGGTSHLQILHYHDIVALETASSDQEAIPTVLTSLTSPQRYFSSCNEGTPDIHGLSADGLSMGIGFHYLPDCARQLDQEAFVTVTNFVFAAGATQDFTRDSAVNAAGFPGKHGGRDDITWHGWRFSLQEAQNSNSDLNDFTAWRYVLYDYTNQQAYAANISDSIASQCHGNPKITLMNDSSGTPVIVVTGIIFKECGNATNETGEFVYAVHQ